MQAPSHQFFWLDLETTGINPARDVILEWAVILCEDGRGDCMAEVEAFSSVVGDTSAPYRAAIDSMDPYVRDMHTKNGLLAECAESDATLADGEDLLCALAEQLGAKPRQIVLAGNSVHFDRGFLMVHMPRFAEYLSHRVFDVSTLIRAERTYGTEQLRGEPAHRALDDVRQSIATTLAWRKARGL